MSHDICIYHMIYAYITRYMHISLDICICHTIYAYVTRYMHMSHDICICHTIYTYITRYMQISWYMHIITWYMNDLMLTVVTCGSLAYSMMCMWCTGWLKCNFVMTTWLCGIWRDPDRGYVMMKSSFLYKSAWYL